MTTGGTELLVVLAIAVMLFGPKKLPELARTLGEAMGEYHKATREFENEVRKASTSVDREIASATSVEPKTPVTTGPMGTGSTRPPPTKAQIPKSKTESYKVKEIAKNLGIETANKTDTQLLREISLKTKTKKG